MEGVREDKRPNPVKEALENYRQLLLQRQALEEARERHHSRATSCSQRLTPCRVSGSQASYDRMAEEIVSVMDADRQLEEADREISREMERVRGLINLTTGREKTVLMYRYLDGLDWEDVAHRTHYSRQHACRIHGDALRTIYRRLGEGGKDVTQCDTTL